PQPSSSSSLPPAGHKFSLAVSQEDEIVGVAIVGRPVSRMLDDGRTLEVTRCCTGGVPMLVLCSTAQPGGSRRTWATLGSSPISWNTRAEYRSKRMAGPVSGKQVAAHRTTPAGHTLHHIFSIARKQANKASS